MKSILLTMLLVSMPLGIVKAQDIQESSPSSTNSRVMVAANQHVGALIDGLLEAIRQGDSAGERYCLKALLDRGSVLDPYMILAKISRSANVQAALQKEGAGQSKVAMYIVQVGCDAYLQSLSYYNSIVVPDGPSSTNQLMPPAGYPFPVTPESIKEEDVRREYEPRYRQAQENNRILNERQRLRLQLDKMERDLRRVFSAAIEAVDDETKKKVIDLVKSHGPGLASAFPDVDFSEHNNLQSPTD